LESNRSLRKDADSRWLSESRSVKVESNVGYVQRSPYKRSATCNPPRAIHFMRAVQPKGRGTYHRPLSHAKTPRRKGDRRAFGHVGYVQRSPFKRSGTCNPPSTIHSMVAIQSKDRGTYQPALVSRKDAKTQRRPQGIRTRRVCAAVPIQTICHMQSTTCHPFHACGSTQRPRNIPTTHVSRQDAKTPRRPRNIPTHPCLTPSGAITPVIDKKSPILQFLPKRLSFLQLTMQMLSLGER
jgi:hypothetical protein